MIRKFETQDLGTVMQIWLQANLDAHAFIPASFWEAHFEMGTISKGFLLQKLRVPRALAKHC